MAAYAGLLDGEGCAAVHRSHRRRVRLRVSISLSTKKKVARESHLFLFHSSDCVVITQPSASWNSAREGASGPTQSLLPPMLDCPQVRCGRGATEAHCRAL